MSAVKSQREITGLLGAIRRGDQQAWDRLASLVQAFDPAVVERPYAPATLPSVR